MGAKIVLREGESVESAYDRLSKTLDRGGWKRELRKRKHFVKAGDQRRTKEHLGKLRARKLDELLGRLTPKKE